MLAIDSERGDVHVEGGACGNSAASVHFCCETKSALKCKAFYFLKSHHMKSVEAVDWWLLEA